MPTRRHALGCILSALSLLPFSTPSLAQDAYPNKAVKLIVNFPAGGPLDILARSLGHELQQSLKQPFVVENKPGAAGNIGAEQVAKSSADGTTVLLGSLAFFVMLFWGLIGMRLLKPRRITRELAVYGGVSPRLLARLPRYPYRRD